MIARGPGAADSRDWAASIAAGMVAREPPTRSALIALSASARRSLNGATTCGWPPAVISRVRRPFGKPQQELGRPALHRGELLRREPGCRVDHQSDRELAGCHGT